MIYEIVARPFRGGRFRRELSSEFLTQCTLANDDLCSMVEVTIPTPRKDASMLTPRNAVPVLKVPTLAHGKFDFAIAKDYPARGEYVGAV